MGFWNALSALAPAAPAMSDAKDLRTSREQDATRFTSDQALAQAQLTTQKLAAQAEQQRITAGNQPIFKNGTQPEFNRVSGTYQQPAWDDKKQAYSMVDVPGISPQELSKQQLDSFKQNRAAAKSMMPPGTSDENLDYLAYTLSGMKPPPAKGAYHSIPGPAGLPQNPSGDGKTWVRPMFDPSTNQTVEVPLQGYTPPVKTPQNDTRFIAITGRPVATWTPEDQEFVQGYKNMIDTKVTQPGVARMGALAQSRVVTPIDPNNPTAEIYTTAGQAMRQGLHAPGSIDYRLQMPTGTERTRADLAISSREQLSDMENILHTRSDLFGPIAGKATNLTQWLGTQDPDAQRFKAAARITADHLAGVFGGRSEKALEAIYQVVGNNATNPAAAVAGLEQMDKAARTIESRGVGPNAVRSLSPPLGSANKAPKTAADYWSQK